MQESSILNFKATGSDKNPVIVFLHFFGGSLHSWDKVIALLQNDYYCIAVDLNGFGASPVPNHSYAVKDSAAQVARLLETLNIGAFSIVGHSMGAKIALYLAAQNVLPIIAIVLVAPSPPTPEPGTDDSRRELLETYSNPEAIKKLLSKLTCKQLPEPEFEEMLNEHMQASKIAWDGWIKKGSREDISALMQDINVPINVISSPDDPNFPTTLLKPIFKQYLPSTKFTEVKNTGHLIPVEVPEVLAEKLRGLVK